MPLKDKEARNKYFRENYHRLHKRLRDFKESRGCLDCGKFYPYFILEFDHIRGTKFKNVAELSTYSDKKLQEEIDKCDVVCSNCHRYRTNARLVEQQTRET